MLIIFHAVATLLMTGVMLVVAVVHYPLFALVGSAGWVSYEAAHLRRITFVVGPLMLIEALLTAGLLFSTLASANPLSPAAGARVLVDGQPMAQVLAAPPLYLVAGGAALLAFCWGVTFFVSVPQHNLLARGFDLKVHSNLCRWNWVRTLAWAVRSFLAVWLLMTLLPRQ